MVRFIIICEGLENGDYDIIYIPLWLDLLCLNQIEFHPNNYNLHSTMVRFIIFVIYSDISIFQIIYIPLWLDLLLGNQTGHGLSVARFTFHYG